MTDGPYELPPGWRWVKLGEACEINPRRPRLNRPDDAPTAFVPMSAVDETTGTIAEPETRPYREVRRGYTYFEEGDVLFAKITPCMENGKAAIARRLHDGLGFGSTEFHVLRPRPESTSEWLWLFIRQERFRDQATAAFRGGVGQQRVPQEFLELQLLPLPPLEEQRRIVARIEELFGRIREARRLREEAKKDAERLMQAALAEVFPRPGSPLPPGWRWVKLGEVAQRKAELVKPSTQTARVLNYLTMDSVAPGQWDEPPPNPTPAANIASACVLFEPDLVLYGKLRPYLNKVVLCSRHGVASTEFVPLQPDRRHVEPAWLAAYLRTPRFVGYASSNTTGSRQPRMRLDALWESLLPLPPIAEQRRIVAYLEQVQQQVTSLQRAQDGTEAELQRLEQSILDRAFRGEL